MYFVLLLNGYGSFSFLFAFMPSKICMAQYNSPHTAAHFLLVYMQAGMSLRVWM